jgi:hypothetical protein
MTSLTGWMQRNDNLLGAASLMCIATFMLYWIFNMEWTAGGGDTASHYLIARYSWEHPTLLLDHWGKPVFTLLAAPWALIGMKGVEVFQCLIFIATAWVMWQICRHIGLKPAFVAVFAVCFAPVFFIHVFSALTELLFAFLICVGWLLFLREKTIWALLLWSLLPMSRSEGVILLPLIALYVLWNGQWKYVPLLAVGALVYSIAGGIFLGDFLWLWNNNPYQTDNSIYGSGSWNHFIDSYQHITHMCIGILALLGILRAVWPGRHTEPLQRKTTAFAGGIVLVFLVFHSYIWWKGLGSYGLLRVFAAVTPLLAVPVVMALDVLWKQGVKFSLLVSILLLGFLVWMTVLPFTKYPLPQQKHTEEVAMQQFADMMKENGYDEGNLYFYDPMLLYYLDRDPWDYSRNFNGLTSSKQKLLSLQRGDMVVWDAHYGPNEGHTPEDFFVEHPEFEKVKIHKATFNTLNNAPYTIILYRRQ